MTSVTAVRAYDFIDRIGIGTHLNWKDAGMAWQDENKVVNCLSHSGIKHIRDAIPLDGFTMPIYQRIVGLGCKFNILTGITPDFSNSGSWAADLGQIAKLEKHRPGCVASIEGPNEINMWPQYYHGQATTQNIAIGKDIQKLLWDQAKAHNDIKHIPVINLTMAIPPGTTQQASGMGNMSAFNNFGTAHVYYGNGDQARGRYKEYGIDVAKHISSTNPVQITETGYYTAVNDMGWGGGGVTEPVQARLLLNLLFAAAQMGSARSFVYQLLDNRTDLNAANTIEQSFGIYRGDGNPKHAGNALHNLTTILADTDGTFAPTALDYTLAGLPATGQHYLMQKASKAFFLAVWAEPDIWDQPNKRQINVADTQVTLNLAASAASVKVYDTLTGTDPVTTKSNVTSVAFGVSDHPVIVEVSGAGSPPDPGGGGGGGGDYDAEIEELWNAVNEQEARLTALIENLHNA
jgi:hypothetical protein